MIPPKVPLRINLLPKRHLPLEPSLRGKTNISNLCPRVWETSQSGIQSWASGRPFSGMFHNEPPSRISGEARGRGGFAQAGDFVRQHCSPRLRLAVQAWDPDPALAKVIPSDRASLRGLFPLELQGKVEAGAVALTASAEGLTRAQPGMEPQVIALPATAHAKQDAVVPGIGLEPGSRDPRDGSRVIQAVLQVQRAPQRQAVFLLRSRCRLGPHPKGYGQAIGIGIGDPGIHRIR
ncbi:MAG: hypothetical protein OXK72_01610, partial [Gammaproteobacteria bacterium]|nr:hypothetical protein [Gammaproteobacteria bacterium]